MQTTAEIRKYFLKYFEKNGHTIVPSSPLVPRNDPTLMFVGAGMVPFKNVFTGVEKRDYVRATTSQKCVRAGGKHNDLENVGYTARHHTFFEMLGNFSFGDYFKERAIELAWNLITKDFGLPKERLLITVYADDEEAAALWKKIAGIKENKIIRIATADNFWSMGETGPCGPCSEIFYDHGDHIAGGPPGSPDEDGDRFVEIWNLVFMQYEQQAGGARIPLPNPSIDTGMGLERITTVLQGVHDNYDIDLFRHLIQASMDASGVAATGAHQMSHRVIADHLRSCSFLISDGVTPSNEGRGYVLRRIMRRAMRHAHLLGCEAPLMWRLVPALVGQMGAAYPELKRAESLITETFQLEEERFKKTLGRGLHLLQQETEKLGSAQPLPGDVAFKLYDTFGFPLDLTQDVLRGENRAVDVDGFSQAMDKQRAEARAAWSGSGEAAEEKIWFSLKDKVGATEFLGYAGTEVEAEITALVKDGVDCPVLKADDKGFLITNQTPFYAESGGQVGDTGRISAADGVEVDVLDTVKKVGDLYVHKVRVLKGSVAVGDAVFMQVAAERRTILRSNHSATHLLHAVLRHFLGNHVLQKGSLVAPDRLRFDFSHPKALTREEVETIEREVNRRIRENTPVRTHLMSAEEAQKGGAMALFGEKYGAEVRVVSMGGEDPGSSVQTPGGDRPFSMELCGGTHVQRTGDIGAFKITAEMGIAAGVRRLEALTGPAVEKYTSGLEASLVKMGEMLKTAPDKVMDRLTALMSDKKALEKDLKAAQQALASGPSAADAEPAKEINGVRYLHRALENVPARDLRGIVDQIKKDLGSGIVLVTSVNEDKVSLVVGVTLDLTATHNAVHLAQTAATLLGGKGGGGRPDLAQAGGVSSQDIPKASKAVEAAIANPEKGSA